MATERDKAQSLMQAALMQPPMAERTAHVEGVPKEWPYDQLHKAALMALRPAVDAQCSKIVLYRGRHEQVTFHVVDLLKDVAQDLGYVPKPVGVVRPGMAAMTIKQRNGIVERLRGFRNIPFAV